MITNLIETTTKAVSKNIKGFYIKEDLIYNGHPINNSSVKYGKTTVHFGNSSQTISFLERTYEWTPCYIKAKEEMLSNIPELDFLEKKDIQTITSCILSNDPTKLSRTLNSIKESISDTLNCNLYEYQREVLINLKKLRKESEDETEKDNLYENSKKLKNSELNPLDLIDLLSKPNQTQPNHLIAKYTSNIFYYLEEVEEFEKISTFIEKARLYEKLVLLNITFCKDELEFELPISSDSNLYQQIVNNLSNVKHFIFKSLTPENIIYNKTKERFELDDVTPIGTNEDIEINWMELLEGKKTFYHHKNLSFPLSYNDVIKLGVDINEY